MRAKILAAWPLFGLFEIFSDYFESWCWKSWLKIIRKVISGSGILSGDANPKCQDFSQTWRTRSPDLSPSHRAIFWARHVHHSFVSSGSLQEAGNSAGSNAIPRGPNLQIRLDYSSNANARDWRSSQTERNQELRHSPSFFTTLGMFL